MKTVRVSAAFALCFFSPMLAQQDDTTAKAHDVTMTSRLAAYTTGSNTSTKPSISEALGVSISTIATAAARLPPAASSDADRTPRL